MGKEAKLFNKIHKLPSLLVSTKHLVVPHLTPDNFDATVSADDYVALLFQIEYFMENEGVMIKNCPLSVPQLTGLQSAPAIALGFEDKLYSEGVGNKDGSLIRMLNGKDWCSVYNGAGVNQLHFGPSQLGTYLSKINPDAFLLPIDHYTEKASVTLKRAKKSTVLSKSWREQISDKYGETYNLWPTIDLHEGGDEEEMIKRIDDIPSNATVISVLYTGAADIRQSWIDRLLTKSALLYYSSPAKPNQIKHLFQKGFSLFNTQMATDFADQGIAIISKGELLDLNEDKFYEDLSMIQDEECGCIACVDKNSRSYIHHLLMTKEMLAHVYLSSHNLWQMMKIIKSLQ